MVELGRLDPTADPADSRPLQVWRCGKAGSVAGRRLEPRSRRKKSDLINATSQLALDQAQFERLSALEPGLVPAHMLLEARRQYECDLIAVQRVRRTLRSWRLSELEIAEVVAEAKRLRDGAHLNETLATGSSTAEHWAKFEIRSPLDGIILERNVMVGDLVRAGADLFKIGDLTTLGVMANLYEEDLQLVESLVGGPRRWTVYVTSRVKTVGIAGQFDTLGSVIDPRQHTATILGSVSNASGTLRAGQLIHAEIASPAAAHTAAVGPPAVRPGSNVQTAIPALQNASNFSCQESRIDSARRPILRHCRRFSIIPVQDRFAAHRLSLRSRRDAGKKPFSPE